MQEVKTTCKGCHGGCRVIVSVKDGRILRIRGDRESFTLGTMCAKGLASVYEHANLNRLIKPLKRVGPRGSGRWKEISWEEALGMITNEMRKVAKNTEKKRFL